MPISLQRMSLDWGRKLGYPEETPEAWGKHADSTHTQGKGRNQTPNPLESRRISVLVSLRTEVRLQNIEF
ncbi:hypothetical protein PGIGA_G00256620 [Pangasianodon gigas]|uniref:Uncharacterized protein n=1 Tax=Pangasianodon gigas TaxID=30993 RepID=A0ACC5WS02_PANGG|nr:hypothetical protein [Pangasianodon gigas]